MRIFGLGVGHEIKQAIPLHIQILLRDILKRLDWGGRSPREDMGGRQYARSRRILVWALATRSNKTVHSIFKSY